MRNSSPPPAMSMMMSCDLLRACATTNEYWSVRVQGIDRMWFERFLEDRAGNLELRSVPRLFHPLARSHSPMAYNSRVEHLGCFDCRPLVCVGQLLREDNALNHTRRQWGLGIHFCKAFAGDEMGTGLKWQVRRGSAKSTTV